MSSLFSLSPLDGRYQDRVSGIANLWSESALIRFRTKVEVEWLVYLCGLLRGKWELNQREANLLKELATLVPDHFVEQVKETEQLTNHDVKAVEMVLRRYLKRHEVRDEVLCLIHFCATSEDINNLSYQLMLAETFQSQLLPLMNEVTGKLKDLSREHADVRMVSRTHGQLATPTTFGKEMAVFWSRLSRVGSGMGSVDLLAKMNGAVGNYNAHVFCFPEIDWPKASAEFIRSLGLEPNELTTQIDDHDSVVQFAASLFHFSRVGIDLCRDIWTYISHGYLRQKVKSSEVGSSTMPHKVNPIDFENAEGNFELASGMAQMFMQKLPISRMQRDLSDSTVMRNLGSMFGYFVLANKSLLKGLSKIQTDEDRMASELKNAWELLAEPIQMVLRKHGDLLAYERLKKFSRGRKLGKPELDQFIDSLSDIPESEKARLKALTPEQYMGLSQELARLAENT